MTERNYATSSDLPFPRSELKRSLIDRFQRQAKKNIDRIAIGTQNGNLTYDDLNRASNVVARAVMDICCGEAKPIALLFNSDAEMIIAIIGVLKAGGFCVPLDPSHPDARNRVILDETNPDLLITNNSGSEKASNLAQELTRVINIDLLSAKQEKPIEETDIQPHSLAFVLYTSGTTAHPKGVVITHRQLMHLVMYHTNTRNICAKDRLSSLTRCHHIGGIADVFRALLNGAALYPYDLRTETTSRLVTWLVDERITILHCVPTILRILLHQLSRELTLADLRLLHLGGEVVTKRDVELYKSRFSDNCLLVNNFGSSETGPLGQYFVNKDTEIVGNIVPVNLGVEDKEIYLVEHTSLPEENGVIGQIAVRSQYLSPGYWSKSDPSATMRFMEEEDSIRTFVSGDLGQIDKNGMLIYFGRKDNQINLHGFRVDLTEIEASIRNLRICKDVVVLASQSEQEQEKLRLVAYIVSNEDREPSRSELRSKLSELIPSYMVPTEIIFLENLPRTATGKVDRLALSKEGRGHVPEISDYLAPQTKTEIQLSELWEELLNLKSLGIQHDFFDLGGDSLFAARLSNRINDIWNIPISINDILGHSTIEKLSALILKTTSLKNDVDLYYE